MYRKFNHFLLLLISCFCLNCIPGSGLQAQTYNDGPIQLQARLRDFNLTFAETDLAIFGIVGQPDDLTYYVWGRDNADVDGVAWGAGTGCLTEDYVLPLTDFNNTFFNFTYPTALVPQFVDIRVDLWEDESPDQLLGIGCQGTRCAYETNFCCGGFLFGVCLGAYDDDDYHCVGNPYATLDYRLGPPCQWYNHGYIAGSCANSAFNSYYNPRIETFWRYTDGDACATAIDLGTLNPGFGSITHFNSNQCYTNAIAYANGGQDVVYEINITQPVGLVAQTCGAGSMASDVLILDNTCTIIASNSGACGNGSQVSQALCTPGIYYVVVEGRTGATGTFTLELLENPSLVVNANAGPNVSVCLGLGVTVGAQSPSTTGSSGVGPYTYNWTPNTFISSNTDPNPTVFPPVTTDYIVEVTDAIGCVDRDTVTVTVNPGPPVNLGPDQLICNSSSVLLDAGPGYSSYFWSTGSFNQTINVSQAGQYIAVVSDFNGCIGRDTINITNYPQPNIFLGNDTAICAGASLTLDPGAGYTYNWSTGVGTQTINVSTAGTYTVTVTDGNTCTTLDEITVGVNPLPVISLGNDTTVCPNEPVVIDPGPGFPTYSWSTGSGNQAIGVNTPGLYSVTVTDVNGCQDTDDREVFNYPAVVTNITGGGALCQGASTTLDAGAGFSSYVWSTGATTQTINVSTAGQYSVTVTGANSCTDADTTTITLTPAPVVSLGGNQFVCPGGSVTLDAGAGFSSYLWSTGDVTQTINVTTPGNYSVTVTDGTGCDGVDAASVFLYTPPTVSLGPDQVLCSGGTVNLDAGAGFASYTWSNGDVTQTSTVSASGTYSATVTDANGCTGTDDINVGISQLSVSLGNDTTICDSGFVMLDAGPAMVSYDWSPPMSNNQYLFVDQSGTYSVTVTDQFGCTASDDITVSTSGLLEGNFLVADTTKCRDEDLLLDAGERWVFYDWGNGDVDQYFLANAAGTYSVVVTDSNGCRFWDTTRVSEAQYPVLSLGPLQNICPDETVTLDAGNGYDTYLWSTGATSQTITVATVGDYGVTVTSGNCEQSDVTAIGDECPGDIFIPNVFTPNGDGLNDLFEIAGVNIVDFSINIFDRWGKHLFSSENMNTSWDGTFNGNSVPEGVYYFNITFKFDGNENLFDESGTVTLLR